ncbi:hypothetical protein [Bacillus sp. FSL W8-0940]|uniref:hypothetical protein n=1 Tax=Bacillus sp. FSL W8-0940 TaxID=2954638 RepID=UPI0030F68BC7
MSVENRLGLNKPFNILIGSQILSNFATLGSVAGMAGGGLLAQWAGVKSAFILSGSLLTAFGAAIMIWSKERGASIVTETHEGTERQTED